MTKHRGRVVVDRTFLHQRIRRIVSYPRSHNKALPLATASDQQPSDREPLSTAATDQIKQVPTLRALRDRIRARTTEVAMELDHSRPLVRNRIDALCRDILNELDQPASYLGWTMVALASSFWREQIIAIPHQRRLLLLPHCMRDPEECPAEFNEIGLLCQGCGACQLKNLRAEAEAMGYQVLIAEGSPVVMQLILNGHADAVLGVSCLNVLERSLEKIVAVGIPSMAVPLFTSDCHDSATDLDWVREMIHTPYRPAKAIGPTYVHLLRAAMRMFEPEELDRLVPRVRNKTVLSKQGLENQEAVEPIATTEAIAYDFLLRGGKRARPFVTLATYDALTGSHATGADGAEQVAQLPDAVKRVALAIEVFHKASLVHDDIEDDDRYRYGHPTLHHRYGSAVAINVGDYLVGLGYRVVVEQRTELGAEVVADILAEFATAHTKLCEGQGAELAWRDAQNKRLSPLEALRIYALKTAPAFEAALCAGLRMAAPLDPIREPIARFSRHLGVAFQILNDLEDWQVDQPNKCVTGTDILGGRPTILWALAMDSLEEEDRCQLETFLRTPNSADEAVCGARHLYEKASVYEKAANLIDRHHHRAIEVADALQPDELRNLLHYLADTILHR